MKKGTLPDSGVRYRCVNNEHHERFYLQSHLYFSTYHMLVL